MKPLTEYLRSNPNLILTPIEGNPRSLTRPITGPQWLEMIEVYGAEPLSTQVTEAPCFMPKLYGYHIEGNKMYWWNVRGPLTKPEYFLHPYFELSSTEELAQRLVKTR